MGGQRLTPTISVQLDLSLTVAVLLVLGVGGCPDSSCHRQNGQHVN